MLRVFGRGKMLLLGSPYLVLWNAPEQSNRGVLTRTNYANPRTNQNYERHTNHRCKMGDAML